MDIVLVNVPIDYTKKPYDDAFSFSKSMNFGILAIASHLKRMDYTVSVFDPQAIDSGNPLNELILYVRQTMPLTIGLSCISGFPYNSFKRYARALRKEFPKIVIIAGGQHHVGVLGEIVLEECDAVDVVVKGEGEQVVERLLRSIKSKDSYESIPNIVYRNKSTIVETRMDNSLEFNDIPKLDIELYHNYHKFPPVIEVSRGCPYSCKFCSSIQKTVRKKDISTIVEEAEAIVTAYNSSSISIYFEAPIMMMTYKEIEELIHIRNERNLSFIWRAETRMEYLNPNRIRMLFNAGMRVVDVGLESGSPEILLRMNKTNSPSSYLDSLIAALPVSHELGLLMKLNLLFYVGDNARTIMESFDFLKQQSDKVKALSAYPLLLYPGSQLSSESEEIANNGGSLVKTSDWVRRHLYPVSSSHDFTYEELQEVGILLGKSFQTIEIFYFQKSNGYYTPGTTYSEFEKSVFRHDIRKLPFSRNDDEMIQSRQELSRVLLSKSNTKNI